MSSVSKTLVGAFAALVALWVATPVAAQDSTAAESDTMAAEPDRGFVYRVEIDGAIQPASAEFLVDAIAKAGDERADALIIELDTPGGLVDSTRD
ncbi:MAG: hypothetical protein P8Y29_06515, partial [Gemmatimonadota bacterium]